MLTWWLRQLEMWGIAKVIRFHHLETVNVSIKAHGNQANSCLLKNTSQITGVAKILLLLTLTLPFVQRCVSDRQTQMPTSPSLVMSKEGLWWRAA